MTDIMIHRGPDDRGIFIDHNVGFGHRRLAILDLSPLGHQPMFNEDKDLVIIFNGEIYNFKELKRQLEKRGHRFQSRTDTEVILHAYEEWGEKAVCKFNGMWAFAIYDLKNKFFFISRDRLGIKPLYYYFDGQKFLFASEIKSILKYPGFKREVDSGALGEYFTFQNILSDKTMFSGIKLLPAGHNLFFDGENLQSKKWWSLAFKLRKWGKKELQDKIVKTFHRSMERHLISDVEIGSFLSGGMDSASIVAIASAHQANLKTFTCGFDLSSVSGMEAAFDERKDAETLAKMFNTNHYEMVLHSGLMEKSMPKLTWHLEDLRTGMCHQEYWIADLAGHFVKVSLSGVGGDELFGGYPWRYKIIENSKKVSDFDKIYYHYWSRLIKDDQKKEFFDKKYQKNIDLNEPYKRYREIIKPVDNIENINKAFYFELKTFLHGILEVSDKVSMAISLETRVPFLDLEMLNLAISIPARLKIKEGTGKLILREAMAKILPKNVLEKKKQGFSPPDASWYRDNSLPYIRSVILSKKALQRGYFNPEYIKKILTEHSLGKKNHRLLIWSFLSFEWWNRIFIDKEKITGLDTNWG